MEVQLAPISANPDVLKLYHKQKTEFHFQQKSDNEFLVFLLDVAVKVISFVDQIKPNLMDACSDELEKEDRSQRKSGDSGNGQLPIVVPKVTPVDEEKRQSTGERPAKIMKQSSLGGLLTFKSYSDTTNFQRQSEILQRQHEIISRQVDTFPFPNLPESVIKPTFVKDGTRRTKLKSGSHGSPASNSHASDGEKTPEQEETNPNNGSDLKMDDSSMEVSSTPTTPLPREYRARSESSSAPTTRHLPIPTGDRQAPLDFHNLSPSKMHEHTLLEQKSRVLDINKIAATTIPSMAYMFSDKLATSAENTSDNLAQRGRHSIGLQWASEYKFDGSALHIMNGRNSRKPRTVFTWEQLKQMEETFKQKKYLCTEDRMILAQKLDLTDEQIKVWFQNRRQKWKKGGSKDDEVIEYSQYYDLFSRDGQTVPGQESDSRDENSQRSINIPDHLRMKTEQICLSTIQHEQQSRALLQEQEQTLKDELQRSIIDLKQSQTNNEERHLIREQQIRAVAEDSNTRAPANQPAHAIAE